MKRKEVRDILRASSPVEDNVIVKGWVRSFRNNQFIAINDGSGLASLQLVLNSESLDEKTTKRITVGACISAEGKIVESQGRGQKYEMRVEKLEILGDADASLYPLQPKKHSMEFLREIAHLRFRTNTFGAIFRLRHLLSYAVHTYFHEKGFYNLHTPIITASDAEGAGEMFKVTNFDLDKPPLDDEGKVDFKKDFFGKETNLTVSGQLEAELGAMALGKVYTFGPTFRAENSNTSRHLAEFWMIEPEVAFADLTDNMNIAEDLLKYCITIVLEQGAEDLAFLNQRFAKEENQKPQNERLGMSLIEKLTFCVDQPFERLTYTQAIDILKNSKPNKKKKFNYIIEEWGADLQSEHERFLVEKHFKKPVILTDYPKEIKAFYMRQNEDDKTVRAMDILFPGIGEIVGGSQREERYDRLTARMKEMGIPVEEMSWYLDTRRFGTAVHSGFGLGFERLVQFVTGMSNIRDVIPFPRTPGNAKF